jgi:hypothetical protein
MKTITGLAFIVIGCAPFEWALLKWMGLKIDMPYNSLKDTWCGFAINQGGAFLVTMLGVYFGIRWSENARRSVESEYNSDLVKRILQQISVRTKNGFRELYEMQKEGNWMIITKHNIKELVSYIPSPDLLTKIKLDSEAFGHIEIIRARVAYADTEFNTYWLTIVGLMEVEKTIMLSLKMNNELREYEKFTQTFHVLTRELVKKFGVDITKFEIPKSTAFDSSEVLEQYFILTTAIGIAIDKQPDGNWNLSEEKKNKIKILTGVAI